MQPLLPMLTDLPVRRRSGQDVRYWSPPPVQVATAPLPVRAIVFARYQDGAKSRVERLAAFDGLSRLIAAPCAVRAPITTEMVDALVRWAGEIPFLRIGLRIAWRSDANGRRPTQIMSRAAAFQFLCGCLSRHVVGAQDALLHSAQNPAFAWETFVQVAGETLVAPAVLGALRSKNLVASATIGRDRFL